jgi:hypothetical protein
MPHFWRRLVFSWREFCRCRKYGVLIRPEHIRAKAEDLGHLAELAGRSIALTEAEMRHLARVEQEMRSLAQMTRQTAFLRVPAEKRMELHESLNLARETLLASMQKGMASEKTQ